MLSAFLSLLTGCAEKSAPSPKAPGVSLRLSYPVLLVGERNLLVKDDERTLITTSVASGGVYYSAYRFIDSASMQYVVKNATAFGKKSVFFDMGTTPFQVFLDLKPVGKIGLAKARSIVLAAATKPEGAIGPHGKEIATDKVGGAKSIRELIEVGRNPWLRN